MTEAGRQERVIVLAPHGRDAPVASQILGDAQVDSSICSGLADFVDELGAGAGAAVITDESLAGADLRDVSDWLKAQPPWSDFPFLVLTRQGGSVERNPNATRLMQILGNVSFLERPFHPTTLVSVVQSALRGRRRQYDARDRLRAVAEAQAELSRERSILEQRVHERTIELVEANDALKSEMKAKLSAEQQLRQAQKMEVFGQLVGGVAHDFNNLLMVIIANIEMTRRRYAPDPQAQRLLESAKAGARRGAELTQRMLAFARKQDLNPDNVDTVLLLSEMTGLLERSVGPLIPIEIDAQQGLPPVRVDRNQLEMALLNLAVNARDAMVDGGTLVIRIHSIEQGAGEEGNGLLPGRYVVIEVIDTGQGMDAATLAKAIEPFFSTKGIGKGTGLGLSMVHGLARQSGGSFTLRSERGKGTTALLSLPAASEPATRLEATPAVECTRGSGHVLVVDDDELVAAGTTAMLEDLGYRVTEVHSGVRAIAALRAGADPDLLITDFAMPQMSGAELSDRVRAMRPELPILLVTGYADLRSDESLDVPKLAKPYTQEQLSAEVHRLLRTRIRSNA